MQREWQWRATTSPARQQWLTSRQWQPQPRALQRENERMVAAVAMQVGARLRLCSAGGGCLQTPIPLECAEEIETAAVAMQRLPRAGGLRALLLVLRAQRLHAWRAR